MRARAARPCIRRPRGRADARSTPPRPPPSHAAAKLHEKYPLSVRELDAFKEICTVDAVKEAEINVLFHLRWDTSACPPTVVIRSALSLLDTADAPAVLREAEIFAQLAMDGARASHPRA